MGRAGEKVLELITKEAVPKEDCAGGGEASGLPGTQAFASFPSAASACWFCPLSGSESPRSL